MDNLEVFKEAMRMSYKFVLIMTTLIGIIFSTISFCIIKYNTTSEISIEATQSDSNNSKQEVKNGETNNKN